LHAGKETHVGTARWSRSDAALDLVERDPSQGALSGPWKSAIDRFTDIATESLARYETLAGKDKDVKRRLAKTTKRIKKWLKSSGKFTSMVNSVPIVTSLPRLTPADIIFGPAPWFAVRAVGGWDRVQRVPVTEASVRDVERFLSRMMMSHNDDHDHDTLEYLRHGF
jgi:hypothetical protein